MDTINITATFSHHLSSFGLKQACFIRGSSSPAPLSSLWSKKKNMFGFFGTGQQSFSVCFNTEVTLRDVKQAGKHYPKLPSMLFLKQSQGPGGFVSSDIPITENTASVERNITTELN